MPIYEYRCGRCQHKLEALQKFSDAPLVDCPACGAPALAKLVSAAGFQLKGSGWYQTDFRGNGTAKPDKSDKAEAPKAESDKTASEPAAKAESPAAKADAPAAAPAPSGSTSTPSAS